MGFTEARGMDRTAPRVSIGLPVYNGEAFLREALDSLLAQTFEDFELIISDNGSIDDTRAICRRYAARDRRIRYVRNERNLGGAWNHNAVVALASGLYFKWAAHDDVCAPTYLSQCVDVLDHDETVVLCHVRTSYFDEHGTRWEEKYPPPGDAEDAPAHRFGYLLRTGRGDLICGVIRAEALRQTGPMGSYVGSDRILLAQLALLGRLHEIPELLFMKRRHPLSSTRQFPDSRERLAWWDPGRAGEITLPNWRRLRAYSASIRQTPLPPAERLSCYLHIITWVSGSRRAKGQWRVLAKDLQIASLLLLGRGARARRLLRGSPAPASGAHGSGGLRRPVPRASDRQEAPRSG